MDSDLPLIEIAGEDDSLVQQLLDPDELSSNQNVNSNFFACSPLQLSMIKPRPSRSKGLKVSMDPSKPSCSSPQSSRNKENINMNKSEVPKLSVEPLQMKKRKKGGGYNLRKSLAWDRAFDTDEGVLDPLELSIITGGFGKSYRQVLPIINEEGKNSLYAGSSCPNETEDFQSIDENLYTELPDRSNMLKEDKEKAACSVPKHDSFNICSTPKATQKFLSMYGGANCGLKHGGCPKPLGSSSLKRPASANTVRVIRNDSKLPKLPASKPGSCLLPANTKNTTLNTSHLKLNQIAKPAANFQKNIGVKSSSNKVKRAQTKAKTSPGVAPSQAKNPAQSSVRNLTNSFLEVQSSTNSRSLQVNRANCGSEVIPQPVVPPTRLHICEGQMSSAAPVISCPPKPCVVGGKMTNPRILSVKPSGLRMPSPSIGFFGQSKASGSDILLLKTVGPCNSTAGSNTHGTRKVGVSRPPPVPGKTSLMTNDIRECVNSCEASISSEQHSAPSALCTVSDIIMKSNLEALNVESVEAENQYDCKSSEAFCWKRNTHGNIEADPKIHQPVDCIKLGETVFKQDSNLQIIDTEALPKVGLNELLEGDKSSELGNVNISFPYEDRRQENKGSTGVDDFHKKSPTGHAPQPVPHGKLSSQNYISDSSTAIEHAKSLEVCELSDQSVQCFESKCHSEPDNGGAIGVCNFSNKSPAGHAQQQAPRVDFSSANCNSDSCTAAEHTKSLEVCELSIHAAKCFESRSHREQENGNAIGIDDEYKPSIGHAQQLAPSTSTDYTGCLKVCHSSDESAKSLETKIVCLASVPTSQFNSEWQSDDSMLLVKTSCSKEPHCKEVIECIVPERNDVSTRRSSVSSVFNIEVPGQSKDGGADIDILSEQPPIEEENVCSLLTENHDHTSANLMLDVSSKGEAMPLNFGTPLTLESGLLVQTTQPSLKRSNVPCKVIGGLNDNVVLKEAGSEMPEEDYVNSQRMEVSSSSLYRESIAVEDSRYYLGDAVSGQGCNEIKETSPRQIQIAGQTHKDFSGVGYLLESHSGDAQDQLFDDDILVGSCSMHKSVSHDQSLKIVGPDGVFEEIPEMPDVSLKVQQVFEDLQLLWKDNLLCGSEEFYKETVADVPEEVYECDLERSKVINQAPPAGLENCLDFAEDLPSVGDAPSGSPGVDSAGYKGFSIDRQIGHSMEPQGHSISSGISNDESTNVSTSCTEICPVSEVSLLTGSVNEMFEKQAEVYNSFLEVEVLANNNQVILKDYLFSKKNNDLKDIQQGNISGSLADIPERSFIYEREPKRSDVDFQVPLAVEESGLEFSEDGQPYVADAPSVSSESLAENHESFTDGQFDHDMEISGHVASDIDSDLKESKDQITGVSTTCKEFCSVHQESCSLVGRDTYLSKSSGQLRIGVDGLKSRDQDETETKDENSHAGELHHELNTAMNVGKDKPATLSIKSSVNNLKLDIPLVKPPPNAVPFSDEWLAAIEAAGEDILTLKCGAVQNSPPDKSLPEPGPWSPVKRKNNQLGPFDCTKFGNTLPADHQ